MDSFGRGEFFFKIASFELVDLPLLRYCASKGKPMIISTGLANMEETDDLIGLPRGGERECPSCARPMYPAPPRS